MHFCCEYQHSLEIHGYYLTGKKKSTSLCFLSTSIYFPLLPNKRPRLPVFTVIAVASLCLSTSSKKCRSPGGFGARTILLETHGFCTAECHDFIYLFIYFLDFLLAPMYNPADERMHLQCLCTAEQSLQSEFLTLYKRGYGKELMYSPRKEEQCMRREN